MKPKIFIGSSVEGLNVAYAIQENLSYDAEATVWNQGIFELSKTTIESLDTALQKSDFGIFVFSPDDILLMRENTTPTVRDNVLFELGLFIGKLGRERVFFIIPNNSELHIPTDLAGITPGKYDPQREDNNYQAATGAACNQIRNQIKKLGQIPSNIATEEPQISNTQENASEDEWINDFFKKDYNSAKQKLEKQMAEKASSDMAQDSIWLAYIDLKINNKAGRDTLEKLFETHQKNAKNSSHIVHIFIWEKYYDKAIELTNILLKNDAKNPDFIALLSECYKAKGDRAKALEILKGAPKGEKPDIAFELADILKDAEKFDEALEALHNAYLEFPNEEVLIYKYARLLHERNKHKEALYLGDILTTRYENDADYWAYLSNYALTLGFYDVALTASKKAEKLSEGKASWILCNIGNILNHKGFHSDAIEWLNKGLAINADSDYGHERLAKALKSRAEEKQKFDKTCEEGKILLQNFIKSDSIQTETR